MAFSQPIEEQETVITFSRNEQVLEVWTNGTTVMNKLDNLVNSENSKWVLKKTGKTAEGDLIDKTYSAPKNCISFRRGVELSAESKEKRRAGMAKTREKSRTATEFSE